MPFTALCGGLFPECFMAQFTIFNLISRIHRCPQNRMSDARPQHLVLHALLQLGNRGLYPRLHGLIETWEQLGDSYARANDDVKFSYLRYYREREPKAVNLSSSLLHENHPCMPAKAHYAYFAQRDQHGIITKRSRSRTALFFSVTFSLQQPSWHRKLPINLEITTLEAIYGNNGEQKRCQYKRRIQCNEYWRTLTFASWKEKQNKKQNKKNRKGFDRQRPNNLESYFDWQVVGSVRYMISPTKWWLFGAQVHLEMLEEVDIL